MYWSAIVARNAVSTYAILDCQSTKHGYPHVSDKGHAYLARYRIPTPCVVHTCVRSIAAT